MITPEELVGIKEDEAFVIDMIDELKCLEKQIEDMQKRATGLKNHIRDIMDYHHVTEMWFGTHKAEIKRYTQSRFDSKSFKADHESMYELYLKAVECERFTIK